MSKFSLANGKLNCPYKIVSIESEDVKVKYELEKYGFCVGEKVVPVATNYTKSSMLVKIMGINFVVDKEVCKGVVVSDE